MKKRVRIYKAQTGMQIPSQSTMQQQMTDEDIINASIGLITDQGLSTEEIIKLFVSQYNLDPRRIQPLIAGLAENIEERKLAKEAEQKGDESTLAKLDQNQQMDSYAADLEDKRKREEMYYSEYSKDPNLEEDFYQQNILGAKYGSEISTKNAFMKKFIKKAQEGMEMPDQRADSTDTGQRKAGLQQFVNSVQSSADRAKIIEEGEALLKLATNKFDRGGLTRGQQRASEQASLLASSLGANPYLPPLERLEVHKTRMFSHAPKAWTAEFGKRPTIEPQQESQSVYTNTVSSPARKQNEKSLEEVDRMTNQEKKKEAANNVTKANQESVSGTGSGGSNSNRQNVTPTSLTTKSYLDFPAFPNVNDFANATAQMVRSNKLPITYSVYVNKEGKVDGSKDFIDPNKSYTFDPLSKKWYRGASSNPVSDKKTIETLNRWKSKGLLEEDVSTEGRSMTNEESQQLMNRLNTLPQAALADDELIQFLTMLGVSPSSVSLPQFAFKNIAKNYLENATKELPSGRILNPGQRMLNPGQRMLNPGQKFLGPGTGYQMGGFADEDSGLYKFIYGGDEFGNKLTNSPYFEEGGLTKAEKGYWQNGQWVEGIHPEDAAELARTNGYVTNMSAQDNYDMMTQRKGLPRVGQSYDDWWTSDGSTPGFAPNNKIWNGTTFVDPSDYKGPIYNNPYIGNQYIGNPYMGGYGYNPYMMGYGTQQYKLKQRGLPIETATGERYMGDFMGAELAKLTARGVRRSGVPRRLEAEFYVDDWNPNNTATTPTSQAVETNDISNDEPRVRSKRKRNILLSDESALNEWLKGAPKPFQIQTTTPETQPAFSPEDPRGQYMKSQLSLPAKPETLPSGYPAVTSGPRNTEMGYGGDLPKAQMYNSQIGIKEPTEQDPRFVPMPELSFVPPPISDMDFSDSIPIEEPVETPVVDTRSEWDPSRIQTKEQAEKEGVEWRDPGPKIDYGKKKVSVKYKTKGKPSNANIRAGLDAFNYGANAILSKVGERGNAERQRQMADRLKADALYGSTGQYDRGDYEANSGLFRPDQMGFTGVARDGGSMYEEGGETWMSEDDIRRFLEEGGELEFV